MGTFMEENATNIENNDVNRILIGKTVNRNDMEKNKIALGDIKNAPLNEQKTTFKKVHIEIVDDENFVPEFASSKYVDYDSVWMERNILTDGAINRWIKMLNTARNTNPYDEIEPPMLTKSMDEITLPMISDDEFQEIPIPSIEPNSPSSDSSEYFSFSEWSTSSDDEQQPLTPTFYNDTEMSALNQSVFELLELSDIYRACDDDL